MTETIEQKAWPVKHSALLRAPERFISRDDLRALVRRLTGNLVSIKDETGAFLLRLDDGRVIDTKGWDGWEWTHGIGLYGMWQYYDQTGETEMRDIIDSWFAARLAEGTVKNVNTMAPFLTLACRYEETGDRTLLPWLDSWAEWAMRAMPRTPHGGMQHITLAEENHHQLWDDTLMMTVMPLTKIGLLLDRPEYVREATFQFLTHVAYLMDRETGLWFHGWSFEGNHNFAKARWARGNSWLTMVIPDFLDLTGLPADDPTRRFLVEVLRSQVAALAGLQDESGLWHTLLDDPSSYLEASATAGFAYGILKAVRKGYLSQEYAPVAERAVRAIIGNISADGELQQVSFGTGMGSDLEFYRKIPCTSMPYGQAMAILCLAEYLRTYC
ncbi:glycoside hydrolase family 88 protein [Kineosporia sp. J2-2]|uniref:Glycoside hydrolase family 88 protein n=1 Tax=Kineosporia corallincola TaxID=2835133 RepID=A0ABS5TRX9_9ACTN|nr:glycoside hydrolase family 88 protein [Kineosporia corallincola]MBT0773541.1 glycoside hydrolase family 88 protein [Kineosporia corallincola]